MSTLVREAFEVVEAIRGYILLQIDHETILVSETALNLLRKGSKPKGFYWAELLAQGLVKPNGQLSSKGLMALSRLKER